jgi:putative ABC transport system permease protein
VVFVAVFAQGLKSSFIGTFDREVRADYVVQGHNGLPLPTDTLNRVQGVTGVKDAATVTLTPVKVAGNTASALGIDPFSFARLWHFDWVNGGSDRLLAGLGIGNAIVEQQTAKGLGLKVGQRFTALTADGRRAAYTVTGEYHDPELLNGILLSDAGMARLTATPQPFDMLIGAQPGAVGPQTLHAIKVALADLPTAQVQTLQQYKDSTVGMVNQLLNLLYGLLAMSVLISVFGIVNTLVLAVYERTREIGLSRAIGMSRRQVRATVRYESVITSVIGALMGIVVGVLFAWIVTTKFAGQGIVFAIPGGQLVVFLIVGVVVGVVAAILPARRAARIDILQAIQYE